MLNCLENTLKLSWQLCDSCQILDLINFQNNLTLPNLNTAGISLDYVFKYSKKNAKTSHSLGSNTDNFLLIQI